MSINALSEAAPSALHTSALKSELEYMAYHAQYTAVYERYQAIPEQDRTLFENVEILSGVVLGSIQHIKEFRKGAETIRARSMREKEVTGHLLDHLIEYCITRKSSPRNLFICILEWTGELMQMAHSDDALRYFDKAEALEIRKYPDLHAMLLYKRAELLSNAGRHEHAYRILSQLGHRYYLIPDRNLVSSILFMLGKTTLLTGQARFYKLLLFRGLRYFYTRDDIRLLFTEQLAKTYRRVYRSVLDRDRSLSEKILFMIHWLYYMVNNSRIAGITGLSKAARIVTLAYVYFLNYGNQRASGDMFLSGWSDRDDKPEHETCLPETAKKTSILITRAMGGIGDLLMMTPGFHALKGKYPDHEIFLAAPREYHQLFIGNDDVKLLDIENASLDTADFGKWFNLTDCPAARVESRTVPDVKMNRIEIFARSLGIRGRRLLRMNRRPRYFLTAAEREFQRSFWQEHALIAKRVIGVQLHAAERYKDYPHMHELVARLAADAVIVLFHNGRSRIRAGNNVIDPAPLSLRKAFALAASCDAIIAPDSAFVHFAAAFDIPCLVLSGPIDGKNRAMPYRNCRFVDARDSLQCVPCWRNEVIPCRLTNMRNSACMENISVEDISRALKKLLEEKP